MTGMSAPGGIGADIAQTLLDGLGEVLRQTIDAWWDNSGPVVLGRAAGVLWGAFCAWVWQSAGPLISSVQVFTRIPPQWTVDLAPLAGFHQRARPLAGAALALAFLVSLVLGGIGLLRGHPFSWLFKGMPLFLMAAGGLLYAAPLMRWWLTLVNAMSDSFFAWDGLPGFATMDTADRLAATGVVGLVWIVFGLWFFVKRVMLIGLIVCLHIAAPFAIVAAAIPTDMTQRFFRWWLMTFLAATIVQVFQSGLLVIGGYLVSAPIVVGGAPSDAVQDLTSVGVGMALIATAAWLPGFLLGGLGAAAGGANFGPVLRMAATLASVSGGAVAGRAAVQMAFGGLGAGSAAGAYAPYGGAIPTPAAGGLAAAGSAGMGGGAVHPGYASVHQVVPSVQVRSLLGSGAPLALPAPQPALPSPPAPPNPAR